MSFKNLCQKLVGLAAIAVCLLGMSLPVSADDQKDDKSKITIIGRVKEALSKKDLIRSHVHITDSAGEFVDSMNTGGHYRASGNDIVEMALFEFKVPRKNATYHIEVSMPGYQTLFYTYELDKIGRREYAREMPDLEMEREPRKLGEVTVTASKIKFYNRGDTIVYNADAFELAEGSMLDALIKQLPGVELKEGGQIYVNGEFVENLLLNGKDFFNGKNEVMLDNLAAYTVKDVEVYKKGSDLDKWAGVEGKKELVMDVKLKREYNAGWMINLEGGAGTSERYMTRAFINRYTDNSRISLVASVNNLNDNRKPGESSTWTPESNTAGTMRTQMAGLDYMAQHPEELWKVNGSATLRHSTQNDTRDVQRTNFLDNGLRTYDYSYQRTRYSNLSLWTDHNATYQTKMTFARASVSGSYNSSTSTSRYLAATFNDERPEITYGIIDTLYNGDPAAIDDIVNRTRTQTYNTGHSGNGSFSIGGNHKIPNTNDYASVNLRASFSSSKNEVWRDYNVNYGNNPTPAIRENQYFDNSPNRNFSLSASTSYKYSVAEYITMTARYSFTHAQSDRDSYNYALDRLSDQGVIGTLPADYLTAFDASRSYNSHTIQNTHEVSMSVSYSGDNSYCYFVPTVRFIDRNFAYFRNFNHYRVSQRHTLFYLPSYCGVASWSLSKFKFNGRETSRHRLTIQVSTESNMPDPVKMIDITDSTDPMNIWLGNPGLKCETDLGATLSWYLNVPVGGNLLSNSTELIYNHTHNTFVDGYTYDTSNGIRVNRSYNIGWGDYVAKLHVNPRLQFGQKSQFTAFYRGGLDFIHSVDMIGTDTELPQRSSVYTYWQAHTLGLSWQIGKQQISFMGQINSRFTDSDQPNFNSITATHSNYSISGQFKLPKGFGISTDFTIYMRRGYGSPELDTTDPVWNARLSYTPPKSNWVIMADGFDMLHQLSNVNYAVNARGRTITYSNVLPRYFMLHLQYRVNIMPKKKIIDTRPDWYRR